MIEEHFEIFDAVWERCRLEASSTHDKALPQAFVGVFPARRDIDWHKAPTAVLKRALVHLRAACPRYDYLTTLCHARKHDRKLSAIAHHVARLN